jgi:hypothetical protein
MIRALFLAAALLALCVTQIFAADDAHDDYHVIIFSYQNARGRARPVQTHTFATWVHTKDKEVVERVDISWGPVKGNIQAVGDSVPGKNKCLTEAINDMQGSKYQYWVLRTDLTFFEAAKKQRDNLKFYKMLDGRSRPKAVNCIHAISDVAGYLETGTHCGISAGQIVNDYYIKSEKAWKADDGWVMPVVLKHCNCKLP